MSSWAWITWNEKRNWRTTKNCLPVSFSTSTFQIDNNDWQSITTRKKTRNHYVKVFPLTINGLKSHSTLLTNKILESVSGISFLQKPRTMKDKMQWLEKCEFSVIKTNEWFFLDRSQKKNSFTEPCSDSVFFSLLQN